MTAPVATLAPSSPSLVGLAALVVLGAARVVPAVVMLPPFGGHHLRWELRAALGGLVAVLGLPALGHAVSSAALLGLGPVEGALILGRELALGLTVGFVASLLFRAAEAAGRLGDTVRGGHLGELASAGDDDRGGPLGLLYGLLATLIFLELGGLGRMVAALTESFRAIPPLGPMSHGLGAANATTVVITASAKLIASAVALAAPLLVASLLADVALGAMARVAPQLPVYFVGLPLKALLGVGAVLLGLGALQLALGNEMTGWWELIQQALASNTR